MDIPSVKGKWATDFTGAEYQEESLPEVATEGDTCDIAYSGSSGWYNARYQFHAGAWQLVGDTAPWQMKA